MRRTTTSPSRTTGRGAIRPMPRIATSGWLTIGVWNRPASFPALVTVNVEPRSSSGCELPGARGLGEALDVGGELLHRSRVAAADDRDDEPLLGLDGDADVVAVEVDDLVALEPGVQFRELLQRRRARLQHGRDQQLQVDAARSRTPPPR